MIGVVFKNCWVFDEDCIFIYLIQTRWSIEKEHTHTCKRLFFHALKSFNMT